MSIIYTLPRVTRATGQCHMTEIQIPDWFTVSCVLGADWFTVSCVLGADWFTVSCVLGPDWMMVSL